VPPLILSTGISGFLGSHVRPVLEACGYAVANLSGEIRRSPDRLRDSLSSAQPVALIHLAGIVDVRYCHEHPLDAFQAHVLDTANLLDAVRLACPRIPFLYIATDKSFGEQQDCGLSTPYRPCYPYDTSKACEDLLVESYRSTYGLAVCLLRFPNFFGEGDRHRERLIPSICLAAAGRRRLVIRTRLDGTLRQYIYVRDAADIVARTLRACLAGEAVRPRNHFGTPHIKTVGDVIRDVETVLGRSLDLEVLNQPGEVSRLSLADENFLCYEYSPWLPSLGRTVEWYREAPAQ
jgi:nucleoside-diphosphate-sugar epimerase